MHCLATFKDKEEENEMLLNFSEVLAALESRDIMDALSLCMPDLFEHMIENTQLICLFSAFLQFPKIGHLVADVLANFLVSSKLDLLKDPDLPAGELVLQLFQSIFSAAANAPKFEHILQQYICVILDVCLKNVAEVENSFLYLKLVRMMFCALSRCKFNLILRDLIPMLQPCLYMFLALLESPIREDKRDLLLELCLTLPARLKSLLPHLPSLMRPLVLCLRERDDIVSLGLRTLEFWIDNLNPEFLEQSMANFMSDVILALWSHLKPAPYPWGGKCLQILGKLGGYNRRFLKEPLAIECKENPEHGLRLILNFQSSTTFLVPLDRFIHIAVSAVMNKGVHVDAFYRKQALRFLHVCLASQLNMPGNVTDELHATRQLFSLLESAEDLSRYKSDTLDNKVCFLLAMNKYMSMLSPVLLLHFAFIADFRIKIIL